MNLTIFCVYLHSFFSHLLFLLMHLIVGDNYKVAGFLSLTSVDSITQARCMSYPRTSNAAIASTYLTCLFLIEVDIKAPVSILK